MKNYWLQKAAAKKPHQGIQMLTFSGHTFGLNEWNESAVYAEIEAAVQALVDKNMKLIEKRLSEEGLLPPWNTESYNCEGWELDL